MKSTSLRNVKSANRTLDVLECLAADARPVSFSELTLELKIPKSSLFHLLGNLTERGYVRINEQGRYLLGAKLYELVDNAKRPTGLAELLDPVLRDLVSELNETCGFNVQRGDEVEVIGTHSGQHALMFMMKKGDLAPLYAVSSGKILLANKDDHWLSEYFKRTHFERYAPNTIQSLDRLLHEIERARAEGFGVVKEEFTPGIVGVGAALVHNAVLIGAFNVAMPVARYSDQVAAKVRQRLRTAISRSQQILTHAGYAPAP